MTSKYEVTKGMTFAVSDAPVTADDFNASGFPGAGITWLEAACATKEITFTGGQKGDIDVTTLCSTEQEQTNGLAAPAEMSITRKTTIAQVDKAMAEMSTQVQAQFNDV
ncbi:hypothetical protein ACIEGJ_16275, partial [Citrobacter freundii]